MILQHDNLRHVVKERGTYLCIGMESPATWHNLLILESSDYCLFWSLQHQSSEKYFNSKEDIRKCIDDMY